MDLGRWAKSCGRAIVCYLGGGLLFALCALILQAYAGLPIEWLTRLIVGLPLLFFFASAYHDCTGRWARANHRLRQASVMTLWVSAFYLGTLAVAALGAVAIPGSWGEPLGLLIFLAPLAGGLAGSLCWRGKLPGSIRAGRKSEV